MVDYTKIRRLRRAKKMSQAELAELIGYRSVCSVSILERGQAGSPLSRLEKISRAQGVKVAQMLTGTNQNAGGTK